MVTRVDSYQMYFISSRNKKGHELKVNKEKEIFILCEKK